MGGKRRAKKPAVEVREEEEMDVEDGDEDGDEVSSFIGHNVS